MFDVGWDEMAVIAVVTLLVIGPKDLPHVLRQMGRFTRKARDMAGEFHRGVDEMVREAELHEIRQQVEKAADVSALQREIENAVDPTGDIARSLEPPVMPAEAAPDLPAEAPIEPPRKPPEP